ncbi:MAG: hypothetical protein ACFCD0_09365 [Gemmataceae bacterium]
MRHSLEVLSVLAGLIFGGSSLLAQSVDKGPLVPPKTSNLWAEIQVVDAATGEGVPLVELETVNGLKFVTDNAGRVAFHEPGLMGKTVFFFVRSHGYEIPKDGFGMAGVRIIPTVGKPAKIKIKRQMLAERLCRLTGEGLYRDTLLLGYERPIPKSKNPGRVAGQDSVQAIVSRNKVYWFWGDTNRMEYPLGLFRVAGATTSVPDPKEAQSDPAHGISFDYFTNKKTGFVRAMMPYPERPKGVVWVESIFVVRDDKGRKRLLGHYSRRQSLAKEYEQGIAIFNDDTAIFESAKRLPLEEGWRRPSGHPIVYREKGVEWLLFGSPHPNVRVRATLADVLDPTKYEAFMCGKATEPDLDKEGKPLWRWQKKWPPTDSQTESRWIKAGKLKPEYARFCLTDASKPGTRVVLHRGSIRWNSYRKRWVLVAGQIGGKRSFLGEVWYAEAKHPTGPFSKAVQIVTHDKQTFYNVCHHGFYDRDEGRTIHFEGTYTNMFSGNPIKTPRYNYNQILYRLDLGAKPLKAAFVN